MKRRAYLSASAENNQRSMTLLSDLLAALRTIYIVHQTAHWQAAGDPAYGDHLLFQRLYESVTGEIDTLAEKMVGMFGGVSVSLVVQGPLIGVMTKQSSQIKGLHERSLYLERSLQTYLKFVYDELKKMGTLSLGMDDFLMATASAHETHVFLLQQVLNKTGHGGRQAGSPVTGESFFFNNPTKREVRELAQTRAVSNIPAVAATSAKEQGESRKEIRKDVALAKVSPPTPTEIAAEPAGKQLGTLNRFLIETDQPVQGDVPESRDDIPKHEQFDPSIATIAKVAFRGWTFAR